MLGVVECDGDENPGMVRFPVVQGQALPLLDYDDIADGRDVNAGPTVSSGSLAFTTFMR